MHSTPHRPFSVTLLTGLVLIIAIGNLIRTLQTIQKWSFLDNLLQISPIYFLITGLLWGMLGLVFAWGLWKRESWALDWIKWIALLYGVHYWVDRLALTRSGTVNRNLLFTTIVLIFVFVWMIWITYRRDVREYFGV
jgi:hypothetical protein